MTNGYWGIVRRENGNMPSWYDSCAFMSYDIVLYTSREEAQRHAEYLNKLYASLETNGQPSRWSFTAEQYHGEVPSRDSWRRTDVREKYE